MEERAWALPGWEASSASCASDWSGGDGWSDGVESSSAGSTQHQRFYRELRARRAPGELGSAGRELRALHALYQQRREAEGATRGRREQEEAVEDWEGQAEREKRGDAARQWLRLLADKVDAVAEELERGPSGAFYAAVEHLVVAERDGSNQEQEQDERDEEDAGWSGLRKMVAEEMAEQVEELDRAVGRLAKAARAHSARQMDCFERYIRQLQEFHNSRVQRAVDESIAELKAVRGRYRKKEARLENELRMANRSIDEWKYRATHTVDNSQSLATIDTLQRQLDAAHSQIEDDRKQYEADLLRVRQMLELANAEREDAMSRRDNDNESATSSLEQTRKQVIELQARCKTLIAQHESAKELYDLENLTLRRTVDDLRSQLETNREKYERQQANLEEALVRQTHEHDKELQTLEIRIKESVRQQVLEHELPERVRQIEQHYEDEFESMKRVHDEQVSDLSTRIQEAMTLIDSKHTETRTIETQTADSRVTEDGESGEDPRVEELTRRCRALEKLLDKKFEDASQSLASSGICASCHSKNASLRLSNASGGVRSVDSRLSSRRRDSPTIKDSKARARALLSSSRSSLEDALFPEAGEGEVTTATEEQTTMNAVDMWDSSSFTSADSIDESASVSRQLPPRAPTSQAPSTQEMAALARKLKRFAVASSSSVASSQREPDPELAGTPRKSDGKVDIAAQFAAAKRARAPFKDRVPSASTGFSSFDDLLQSLAARRSDGH